MYSFHALVRFFSAKVQILFHSAKFLAHKASESMNIYRIRNFFCTFFLEIRIISVIFAFANVCHIIHKEVNGLSLPNGNGYFEPLCVTDVTLVFQTYPIYLYYSPRIMFPISKVYDSSVTSVTLILISLHPSLLAPFQAPV